MTLISPLRLRPAALAVAAAMIALLMPAAAQDLPPPTVIATIDGEPITDIDLGLALSEFEDQLGQIPPAQRNQAVLDLLINIRLAGKAAIAAGIDRKPLVEKRLDLIRNRTLYSEFLRNAFAAAVTEENVRRKYDAEVAAFVPGDQVHASHILVKTADEAKAIIADLDAGGDFAAIAKDKSLDPGSGANGGDLGFFGRGMMVPPFEEAAFALAAGAHSKEPVETSFGFHIIKVVETRKEPAPTFAAELPRLQQDLVRETFEKEMGALRAAARIEIVPPPAPTPAQ